MAKLAMRTLGGLQSARAKKTMIPCKLRLWQHVDFDVDVCVDVHVDGVLYTSCNALFLACVDACLFHGNSVHTVVDSCEMLSRRHSLAPGHIRQCAS